MNKKGFTLIELIISLTIFSLVLSSSFLFLGTRLNTYKKEKNILNQYQLEQRVFNLIAKDLKKSIELDIISSSEAKITLKNQEVIYGIKDQKIKRKTGKNNAYLTMPGEINNLAFKALSPQLIELGVGGLKQTICLRNKLD